METAGDLFYKSVKEYGLFLVFRRLWEELGLGKFPARRARSGGLLA